MKNAHPHTQLTLNIIVVGLIAILFVLFLDLNSRMKWQEEQTQAIGDVMAQMEDAE